MAAKQLKLSTDARDRMLRGVDILASAVRFTLGPKGRNVILSKSYGSSRITKDGITVAKEIELEDKHGRADGPRGSPVHQRRGRRRNHHRHRSRPCEP